MQMLAKCPQKEQASHSWASSDYLHRCGEYLLFSWDVRQEFINVSHTDSRIWKRVHFLSFNTKNKRYFCTFQISFYLSFFETIMVTSRRVFFTEGSKSGGYLMVPNKRASTHKIEAMTITEVDGGHIDRTLLRYMSDRIPAPSFSVTDISRDE